MRNYSTRKSTECLAMFRETAMTASHDRVGYQYVLGYQTMQFCIGNPMNQFLTCYDDAMRSYHVRNIGLGVNPGNLFLLWKVQARRCAPGQIWLKVVELVLSWTKSVWNLVWRGINTEQISSVSCFDLLLDFRIGFYLSSAWVPTKIGWFRGTLWDPICNAWPIPSLSPSYFPLSLCSSIEFPMQICYINWT